jgi:hypothetical protein
VTVVKGVIDRSKVETLLAECKEYLTSNPHNGFPTDSDKKVVYETYWSPSQIKVRRVSSQCHDSALYTELDPL